MLVRKVPQESVREGDVANIEGIGAFYTNSGK